MLNLLKLKAHAHFFELFWQRSILFSSVCQQKNRLQCHFSYRCLLAACQSPITINSGFLTIFLKKMHCRNNISVNYYWIFPTKYESTNEKIPVFAGKPSLVVLREFEKAEKHWNKNWWTSHISLWRMQGVKQFFYQLKVVEKVRERTNGLELLADTDIWKFRIQIIFHFEVPHFWGLISLCKCRGCLSQRGGCNQIDGGESKKTL